MASTITPPISRSDTVNHSQEEKMLLNLQQFYLKTSDANEKKAVEMLDKLMEEETFRA